MGKLRDKSDYESLRNARISENQARLASLGINKCAGELRAFVSPAKSTSSSPRKNWKTLAKEITSLRRSERLKGKPCTAAPNTPPTPEVTEIERKGFAIRRCDSKGRGSVYDPVVGICCHFCRQKKLCGEEDCRRCGDRDIDQPCIGKTDCSACHSSNGVLCRACLKVRYGEELEEVRENKEWMCPHCIEEKGIRPYWICNSSFCLKKRQMIPTGIAIYQARAMGYESVAHLLMEKLKRSAR